ncbi:hypothetical protein HQ520_17265 [bacterium]|nr:hypothetical protein [bacterium]
MVLHIDEIRGNPGSRVASSSGAAGIRSVEQAILAALSKNEGGKYSPKTLPYIADTIHEILPGQDPSHLLVLHTLESLLCRGMISVSGQDTRTGGWVWNLTDRGLRASGGETIVKTDRAPADEALAPW